MIITPTAEGAIPSNSLIAMREAAGLQGAATFGLYLENLTARIEQVNRANGWYDDTRTPMEECMLLVTEVAEAAECYRNGEMETTIRESDGKPEGFPSEMADILIRLLDTCARHEIDLLHETEQKLAYNATRGHRHGGKTL